MDIELLKLYNILIACLKKDKHKPEADLVSSLSAQDWQDMLSLANMQRIMPLLWHRLKQKNLDSLVPETALAILSESSRRNVLQNLRLNGELSRLLTLLGKENIPVILLKGIVMSNAVYENISLREMNDIDILSRPGDLEQIAACLVEMGYQPMKPLSEGIHVTQKGHHLPQFIKKNRAHFEIHWNITNPDRSFSIEPQGLWERAISVQIANHKTQMLSAEDLLLHLCMHTSYLHPFTFGLRPFCDIAEMIDYFDLDWGVVVDRACIQKWQRGVYLALRLAIDLAGASIPDDVLASLQPADISNVILETVRAQIFTDKYFATSIPRPFAELLESRRLIDKIRILHQRVFLPKNVISNLYAVPIASPIIYFFYLRRFYDVLRRHGCTLKKYQQKDDAVKSLAERTNIIADWIG